MYSFKIMTGCSSEEQYKDNFKQIISGILVTEEEHSIDQGVEVIDKAKAENLDDNNLCGWF